MRGRNVFGITSALLGLVFGSCAVSSEGQISASPKPSVYHITGRVDDEFLRKVQDIEEREAVLVINSYGGSPKPALKIANIILEKKHSVVITDYCSSACAEYILPAAHTVTFKNEPLIGFHWNASMLRHLYEERATKNLQYCKPVTEINLRDLRTRTGTNPEFWRETLKRLKLKVFNLTYKEKRCPRYTKYFEIKEWFPTSVQLREGFGLNFKGNLCSDSAMCYRDKLPRTRRYGNFYVGNSFFYSYPGLIRNSVSKTESSNDVAPE